VVSHGEEKFTMSRTARTLEFIFDVASPNAYLAYQVIPGVLQRTGAELELSPCLLGGVFKATGNQAPMLAFGGVKGKLAYEMLETRRFIEKHGLSRFRMNPFFPVNTLMIMRAAVAAEMEGRLPPYLDAVMPAMWEDGLKMDDPVVVQGVLDRAGLGDLIARTQDDAVKARLAANTQAAVDRGVFGIPSFFVGEEMFFGKERLGQVEEALGG
jgi:2-hydroxychromene-2-carboxylate isomerase